MTRTRRSSHRALALALLLATTLGGCAGCYSFRQGAALPHLKSVYIPPVEDNSGSGRATVRQDLTQRLIQRFRDDNTFNVLDNAAADARLDVTISSINDQERGNISGAELETTRRVVIQVRATLTDNVLRKSVYSDRVFNGVGQFNISQGESGVAEAIRVALEQLTTELLLESVSQW